MKTIDTIYKHKYYIRAALGILNCLEDLEKNPELKNVEPTRKPFVKKDHHKTEMDTEVDTDINGLEKIKEVNLQSGLTVANNLFSCNQMNPFILYQLMKYYIAIHDNSAILKVLKYFSIALLWMD